MKLTAAITLGLALAAGSARADTRHVLVLKSEGAVDAATRTRIDSAVLKLAKNVDASVTAGDITYGDAAAAVGCAPDSSTCKDEVLTTLAVDEIIATTISSAPNGFKVVVRRASKSGSQDATTVIAANQSDHLDGIGPLFGLATTATVPVPGPESKPASPTTAPPGPTAAPAGATGPTAAALPPPSNVPTDVDDHAGRRNWEIAGIAGGGGMMLLGALLWGAASSTQDEINKAATSTSADLKHLKDLESKGDGQAGLGNILFIGGVALAAVSGYFYYRDHRSHRSQTARVVPTVLDHGAGISLVIGGSP